ncbi:hypothetical protein FIBSPDRAFT_970230 [Athelia psychrophila]|uniref:Uncharacterized protein n=1 Tax=Athelia psychrophila TaxID=1759441 RepID=A0A167SUE4_9AGAM|nr:hypothetical protein FIBSPDRAFT_970230 [Fibularhizoctonia sp. CBS 109695]
MSYFAGREIEHPKWWDKEDQKVHIWTTRRFKPVPVGRLLGTYRFFDMQEEFDPFIHMGDAPGYLTLEVAPGMPNTPENVQGHFAMSNGWWTGSFSGLTAFHMPDPNDARNSENAWEITLHPDPEPKYGLSSDRTWARGR